MDIDTDITIVVQTLEGLEDGDHPPVAFAGHLDLEQVTKIAREWGSGYPYCRVDPYDDDESGFYACFSNEEKPKLDEVGALDPEAKGHLELHFHLTCLETL